MRRRSREQSLIVPPQFSLGRPRATSGLRSDIRALLGYPMISIHALGSSQAVLAFRRTLLLPFHEMTILEYFI